MRVRKSLSAALVWLQRRVDGNVWVPGEVFSYAIPGLRAIRPRRFRTVDDLREFSEQITAGVAAGGIAPLPAELKLIFTGGAQSATIERKPDEAGLRQAATFRKKLSMQVAIFETGSAGEPLTSLFASIRIHMSIDRNDEAGGAYTALVDETGTRDGAALLHSVAQLLERRTVPVGPILLRKSDTAIVDPIDSSEARREKINRSMQWRAALLGVLFGTLGGWISTGGARDFVLQIFDQF